MKRTCSFAKHNGERCRANATTTSEFCFFHDPECSAERHKAQQAGGLRNRPAVLSVETADYPLNSVSDVMTILGKTINEVRKGLIDPRVANAVGYLSATLLKAQELGNLEQRVSTLEAVTRQPTQKSTLDEEEFFFVSRSINDQQHTTDSN